MVLYGPSVCHDVCDGLGFGDQAALAWPCAAPALALIVKPRVLCSSSRNVMAISQGCKQSWKRSAGTAADG